MRNESSSTTPKNGLMGVCRPNSLLVLCYNWLLYTHFTDNSACANNRCENGRCRPKRRSGGYRCRCKRGWSGRFCNQGENNQIIFLTKYHDSDATPVLLSEPFDVLHERENLNYSFGYQIHTLINCTWSTGFSRCCQKIKVPVLSCYSKVLWVIMLFC